MTSRPVQGNLGYGGLGLPAFFTRPAPGSDYRGPEPAPEPAAREEPSGDGLDRLVTDDQGRSWVMTPDERRVHALAAARGLALAVAGFRRKAGRSYALSRSDGDLVFGTCCDGNIGATLGDCEQWLRGAR